MFTSLARRRHHIVEVGGGLVYAVGDVHGRLDLLLRLLARIEAHAVGRPAHLVFLGDYVDRGADSRGVVEHLLRLHQRGGVTCLKGNHEDMMVAAVRDRGQALSRWRDNGGFETLRSYGAASPVDIAVVPAHHLEWMAGLPLLARDAHRIYVHAGLLPGRAPDKQEERACLWIRERFLRAPAEGLPDHVVHGHTPEWEGKPQASSPELLPHRTNLDTGAYYTDVLTAAVFESDRAGGPVELLT